MRRGSDHSFLCVRDPVNDRVAIYLRRLSVKIKIDQPNDFSEKAEWMTISDNEKGVVTGCDSAALSLRLVSLFFSLYLNQIV